MTKKIFVLMIGLVTGLTSFLESAQSAPPVQSKMSAVSPVRIERASVIPQGAFSLDAALAYELGREWLDREYDNLRIAPLGMRYGVAPSFEIGGYFAFSANNQDDVGAPDDSGLEGLTVFGKVELNRFAALQFGLNFAGDEDVFPYPSDDLDIFADLALQRPIGNGLLYGEFGYTVQGGDFDTNQYFNYGLGYAFPLAPSFGLNFELTGQEAHVGTFANTLDLLFGGNLVVNEMMRLAPFVTVGLFNASPDLSFGTALEIRL